MAIDRFLIAPYDERSGLHSELKPWLIPDNAWAEMNNAYVWRGRVKKRFGERYTGVSTGIAVDQLSSRLRIHVGVTNGGVVAGNVDGKLNEGSIFSIGSAILTVPSNGAVVVLLSTSGTISGVVNTTLPTGTFSITAASVGVDIFFYPALPVMGLTLYETGPVNNQPSYAFDTQFAYEFTGANWIRSSNGAGAAEIPVFHGDDTNFFWATNWRGASAATTVMFVSNFQTSSLLNTTSPTGLGTVTDDPIWSFDGTTWTPYSYLPNAVLNPLNVQPKTVTTAKTVTPTIITNYIQSALIILPFRNRLVMLNTVENNNNGAGAATPITAAAYLTSTNTHYPNRCRYSINGSPFAPEAWLEPNQKYNDGTGVKNAAGAGFIDAATQEAIIGAEFIKDRLVVYFERSTWELVYTGNEVLPFIWQKINTELGSESTFSTVPFDKEVLAIGNTGVHSCNGSNVQRIDSAIPEKVFQIRDDNSGIKRVYGIRDYFNEMVYWTYPSMNQGDDQPFPNKVLVYNYRNGTWSFNDDCITVFGYMEQSFDLVWQNAHFTWEETDNTWVSNVIESESRQVIAGNHQGYVFLVDADRARNEGVMQITSLTYLGTNISLIIKDHMLQDGDFIRIENAVGITGLNGNIFEITSVPNHDLVQIDTLVAPTGTYLGGGTITRVSRIDLLSKQWNFYINQGRNAYINKIDFQVNRTTAANITVDMYTSSSTQSLLIDGLASGAILGTNVLETFPYPSITFEQFQDRLWHPIYLQGDGEFIQMRIFYNDDQMKIPSTSQEFFELHSLIVYAQPTSSRLQ